MVSAVCTTENNAGSQVDVRQTLATQASERNGDQCGCFLFSTEIKLT